MRIDIMTLFPDAVNAMMDSSIIGRAQERGFVTIRTHQIREYTTNKQMQVDDYPYGGGRGAVMQADPLYRCWQHICDEAGERVHTIYMSPCGRVLTQRVARELKAQYDRLILVCGHYEGVDQRFLDECVARPQGAGGAAQRTPRQRSRLADEGELQAHHGAPSRPVGEIRSDTGTQPPREEGAGAGTGGVPAGAGQRGGNGRINLRRRACARRFFC